MQLLVVTFLGCCVVIHSASLSETLAVSKSFERINSVPEFVKSEGELSLDDIKREKRSGSGGFLSGIGSAILGKVAEASRGVSSSSSDSRNEHQYESVEYGPPVYGHDSNQNFDIWSFKKAILNTLFQALKAIGGGVIALKGKLIKGGGIIISAKGNIISAKGEAISGLGRQIAASAILTPPKSTQTYVYEAPVHHGHTDHESYAGPPPSAYGHHGGYAASASSDSYGHSSAYASPSDDAAQPGLVIAKPLIPESKQRLLTALAQSFGGNQKDSGLGDIIGQISTASKTNGQGNLGKGVVSTGITYDVAHSEEHVEHKEHHPASNYGPVDFGNDDNDHSHVQQTHVVYNEQNSDTGKPGSPVSSVSLTSHSQGNDHLHYDQNLNLYPGFGSVGSSHQLSQSNYPSAGNGHYGFSMPLEIPILETHNQIQDFNSYYGLQRRDVGLKNPAATGVNVSPAIGYTLKDSGIYRI